MSNLLLDREGGVLDMIGSRTNKRPTKHRCFVLAVTGALVMGLTAQAPQAYEIPPVLSATMAEVFMISWT